MARIAEGHPEDRDKATTPPTSRRWFLRAAALTATSLVVAACSKKHAPEDEHAQTDPELEPDVGEIPRPPTHEPIVRVRLRSVMPPADPIEIGPQQQWLRISEPTEDQTLAVLRGPVQLSRREGAWALVDGRGFSPWMSDAASIRISPLRDPEPIVLVDGKAYPGVVQLHSRLDRHADAFDLVNHVPLEKYIPGVLARELYNHWHQETHTAQAVAARTFAITESVFWQTRRHFDVTNTEASQMYDGLTTHEESLEAVRTTRGVVLAYRDQLVPGYYSSSCGGLAARAVDAISTNPINDVPPLHGHFGEDACTSLQQQRWDVTHAISTLGDRIAAFGKAYNHQSLAEIGRIESVDMSETNEHGRPTRFAIRMGAAPRIEMLAEQLRWAANFTEEPLSSKERLLSSFVEPATGQSHITFHGRGRGHGAGLCQYGAEMMARNGTRAMEMLKFYYPGVEVVGSYA